MSNYGTISRLVMFKITMRGFFSGIQAGNCIMNMEQNNVCKIHIRYYSIILFFAIVFLSIPLIADVKPADITKNDLLYTGGSNSIDGQSGNKLYFLPYVPEVRQIYETITSFFSIFGAAVFGNKIEYFKAVNENFLLEIKKINIEWYHLADGEK